MARGDYAATYGPTVPSTALPFTLLPALRLLTRALWVVQVGDRVTLGDTCLQVRVEEDFTTYGDECKFGGGKVLDT